MTRNHVPECAPQVHTVVNSSLRCTAPSPANRRRAQALVWQWVRSKWPRLIPAPGEMARDSIERAVPGQKLVVEGAGDGRTWRLSIAHTSDRGGRMWLMNVLVEGAANADVLSVQISWAGNAGSPLVVAPPRLLSLWVENLKLDDGGVAVIGEPHAVGDCQQVKAFCSHVLSDARTLPVIALAHGARSRYYGVDPRALAGALSGLAHVACLSPTAASVVCERLGGALGPGSGAARIYAPGFSTLAAPNDHPLLRPERLRSGTTSEAPGSFRRSLVEHICAVSVDWAAMIRRRSARADCVIV